MKNGLPPVPSDPARTPRPGSSYSSDGRSPDLRVVAFPILPGLLRASGSIGVARRLQLRGQSRTWPADMRAAPCSLLIPDTRFCGTGTIGTSGSGSPAESSIVFLHLHLHLHQLPVAARVHAVGQLPAGNRRIPAVAPHRADPATDGSVKVRPTGHPCPHLACAQAAVDAGGLIGGGGGVVRRFGSNALP